MNLVQEEVGCSQKEMKSKPYTAKILLFGEYGIIKDAMGLSIPYDFYRGALVYKDDKMSEEKSREADVSRAVAHLSSNASMVVVAGILFGISTTVVTPPATAANDSLAKVALCVSPGSRK